MNPLIPKPSSTPDCNGTHQTLFVERRTSLFCKSCLRCHAVQGASVAEAGAVAKAGAVAEAGGNGAVSVLKILTNREGAAQRMPIFDENLWAAK